MGGFKPRIKSVFPMDIPLCRGLDNAESLLDGGKGAVHPSGSGPVDLILDFGRETVGGILVSGEAESGFHLTLHYGEDLEECLRTDDYTQGWVHLPEDILVVPAGEFSVRSPGRRAYRYVRLTVDNEAPGFRLTGIRGWHQHYPTSETAAFSCSDPLLNRIWRTARHTLQCCMQGFYEDGVKRDGLLWVGDYRIEFLINTLLFGDTDLALGSLGLIAASVGPDGRLPAAAICSGGHQHPWSIPYMTSVNDRSLGNWFLAGYSADYLCSIPEYLLATGDEGSVRRFWPTVRKVAGHVMTLDPDSLGPVGSDCALIDTECDPANWWWSSPGALRAQLAWGLAEAAALAVRLGETGDAGVLAGYADSFRRDLLEKHLIPGTRLFSDEALSGLPSRHATIMAVLAGAVGEPRATLIELLAIQGSRPVVSGLVEFWKLEALFSSGLGEHALDDMRAYFGHMLDAGATSFWEVCHLGIPGIPKPEAFPVSHCHGWNAGPCYLLPRHVLGISPASPGYGDVLIRPNLYGLEWAEGTVCTCNGDVRLRLSATPTGSVRCSVALPQGMTGLLVYPGLPPVRLGPGSHDFGGM